MLLNDGQVYSTGASAIPNVVSEPRIVLTGTLAIDYVAQYAGVFADLPRHRGINLAVQLESIERRFGGCAMNITRGPPNKRSGRPHRAQPGRAVARCSDQRMRASGKTGRHKGGPYGAARKTR